MVYFNCILCFKYWRREKKNLFCADFWDNLTKCILCFGLGYIQCCAEFLGRVPTFLCMESQASVISRFVVFPRTSCPYWVWRVYSNLVFMSSDIWQSHKKLIDISSTSSQQLHNSFLFHRNMKSRTTNNQLHSIFLFHKKKLTYLRNQVPQKISYTAFFTS